MSYCNQTALPAQEPVTLQMVKDRLRLTNVDGPQDQMLTDLIAGARLDAERCSGLRLAKRPFQQALDSFPYFTDTIQSQLAYPPSYYSLPRYSTTLWNYSQMIKLAEAPLISVENITYIADTGDPKVLQAGVDFILDPVTKLARIFPMVGKYWPSALYTPNSVVINFTAGYEPDPTAITTYGLPSPPPAPPNQQVQYKVVTGIPQSFIDAMSGLVVWRYQHPGEVGVPLKFEQAFQAMGVVDFAPTRG